MKPKIRFKEFNEEYNSTSISNIITDHNAGIYIEKSKYGSGNNIVGVSNLYDNTKIDGQIFRYAPLTDEEKEKYLLDTNDIIYGESSLVPLGIAMTLAVTEKGKGTAFEWHTRRIKIDNSKVNSFYLSYMLNYFVKTRNHLASVSTQTALTGITTKDFMNTKFNYPSLIEQDKVVNMIDVLDKKIELQNIKIDKLRFFKQGCIKKIMSNIGSEKKLIDICSYKNGNSYENNVDSNGNYYLISLNSVDINGNLKCEMKKVKLENPITLLKNDIVMVLSDVAHGDFLGISSIIPEDDKYVLNQRMGLLRVIDDSNPMYVVCAINAIQKKFKILGQGSSQLNLSKNDIMNVKIKYPNKVEQDKIAGFFDTINKKIDLENNRLSKLNELKKGLIQNMFV